MNSALVRYKTMWVKEQEKGAFGTNICQKKKKYIYFKYIVLKLTHKFHTIEKN